MLSRPKSSHPVSLNQSELSSLECPRNHPQSAQSLQAIDASEFWATTQFNTARQQETTNEFRTKSFVITSTIQYDFLPKTPLLSSRSSRTARGQHTWLQASNTMVGVIQSRVVVWLCSCKLLKKMEPQDYPKSSSHSSHSLWANIVITSGCCLNCHLASHKSLMNFVASRSSSSAWLAALWEDGKHRITSSQVDQSPDFGSGLFRFKL